MKKMILSAMLFLNTGIAVAEETASVAETAIARSPFALPGVWWLLLVIAALIVAFIVIGNMRAQLKTAVKKAGAANYIQEGSLNLDVNYDVFLYRTENRRKIEQEKKEG